MHTSTSVDVRLAILEGNVARLENRITEVSNRTHTLMNEVSGVSVTLKEASERREDMIEKIDAVQDTVNAMSVASARSVTEMAQHVRMCDRRSARLEKLAWGAISALVAALSFLAAPYFNLPHL